MDREAAEQPRFSRDPQVITWPDIEGPPLTDALIRKAEQILGVRLPESYVDLMRRCNGGYVEPVGFPTQRPTSWASNHVPLRSINGITDPGAVVFDPTGSGILATPYLTEEWGLPTGLVLLDGEGHTWIALDYRASGPDGQPSVVWIDVELEDELQLAPSFEIFLQGLRPDADFREED